MMTAMRAAENILGAKHDLWAINTEAEYHEERRESSPSASPQQVGRAERVSDAGPRDPAMPHATAARGEAEKRKPS